MVFDEISQVGIFLFADRRFQRNRVLCDLFDLAYLGKGYAHGFGKLFIGCLTPILLQQLAGNAIQLIDRLYHVYRHTNGTCLVCNGTCDSLPDPPCSIGGEFIALGIVEFIDRL